MSLSATTEQVNMPPDAVASKWVYYTVAFFSGGSVMACELLGAKMIAPYYGTSLYVWTAVLGNTLGGLTAGYFLGGTISAKYPNNKTLLVIILLASLFMGIMPLTSKTIMEATLELDIRTGSTVSCLFFLFPPLACFGMVSPVIIRLITDKISKVGKYAGTVYAVSTVGGIITTFLFGFYIIPYWGLQMGSFTTAGILAIVSIFYLVMSKKV